MSENDSTPDNDETQTSTGKTHLLAEGRLLANRYRIGDVLGLGGMGMVYKARDETLNVDVALKVLRDDRDSGADQRTLDRFHQELVLARQVSHRNVVRIHDLGRDGEVYFLTMDLVEGRSLKDIIDEREKLPVARALDITRQLALGLAAAHDTGVVHRDLKPANILIDENNTPYITDFGVARSATSSALTQTGHIVGTPDYLSPEQARGGDLDGRSDIYSLGLILYEMLSGELPFSGETYQEILAQRAMGKPRELSVQVPPAVKRIIEHCLARNPEDRYDSAMQLAEDLGEGQATQVMLKRRGRQARTALAFAALGIVFAGLVAGGYWLYLQSAEPTTGEVAAISEALSVAILPLQDDSGRPELAWLRTGIPELAADQIGDGQTLQLVDPNRVLQTLADLKMLDRPASPADLRQAAELLGAQKLVTGNIRAAGEAVRIDARAISIGDAGAGEQTFSVEVRGDDQLFELINRFARALQAQLALGSETELVEGRLSESQTALRNYTEGVQQLYLGNSVSAAPLLEAAVADDPGFAAAWLRLSDAYQMLGFGDKSIQAIQNASNLLADSSSRIALEARAREATLTGDLERAQTTLGTIVERYPGDSEARVMLALAHEDEGELDQAIEVLRKVLASDPNHPRAWFLMGKYAILTGEVQAAIDEYLVRALVIQNRLGNEQGRADALNAMGIAYHRLGQLDQAEDHYRQAAEIRNRIGDQRGVASSRTNTARILVAKGEHEQARSEFLQAMDSREAIGDRPGVAVLHNEIGLLEESLGRYAEALSSYRQSLQIRRQLGDKRALTESYNNVGFAYFTLGEYDNASVYWQQALDTAGELDNQEDVALARQNIGLLDLARGRWENALRAFLSTLDDGRALGNPLIEAVSRGNLGRIAMYQGRYAAAEISFAEAIQILAAFEDTRGEAEYRLFSTELHLELGQNDEAENELDLIEALITTQGNREQLARLAMLRGRLAIAQRRPGDARKFLAAALETAADSSNPVTSLWVRLTDASERLSRSKLDATEARALFNQASALGNFPLRLAALQLATLQALQDGQHVDAERTARRWLQGAQSTESYANTWRAWQALAMALNGQNKTREAAAARKRASDELDRLLQNMDDEQRRSFRELPAARELINGT